LQDRSDLPVVRGERGADDDPLPAQRHASDWLRRDPERSGARRGLTGNYTGEGPMSNKREREKRREQRLQEETKADAGERRTRLLQLGAGAVFLAIAVVVVLIVVNPSDNGGGDATNLKEVSAVDSLVGGVPQNGMVLGKPGAKVELIEYGDLQCPVCKAYSEEILPQVIENKVDGGAAKIAFHNFTIIGEQSGPAGAAALAAGAQGR